jgi:hypothetical protein
MLKRSSFADVDPKEKLSKKFAKNEANAVTRMVS